MMLRDFLYGGALRARDAQELSCDEHWLLLT